MFNGCVRFVCSNSCNHIVFVHVARVLRAWHCLINFEFRGPQHNCRFSCIGFSSVLCSVWLPTSGFHSALVPAVYSTVVDSQFQDHRREADFSLWDLILDKDQCRNHRPCQGLLDFNMVAERELTEIIAWAVEDVPVHCDHLLRGRSRARGVQDARETELAKKMVLH